MFGALALVARPGGEATTTTSTGTGRATPGLGVGHTRRVRWRGIGFLVSALLCAGGLGLGALRVVELQRAELAYEGDWRSLDQLARAPGATLVSARLAMVELRAGQQALFELCSQDRLLETRWRDAFVLAVLAQPQPRLMLRVPLDHAHLEAARRSADGACLPLGGGRIQRSGDYSVEAVWPQHPPPASLRQVPLRARVLARVPLGLVDRGCVIALGLGVTLGLGLLLGGGRGAALQAAQPVALRALPAALGAVLGLLALTAAAEVPSRGASQTLLKGLILVALQAGVAWSLARRLWPGKVAEQLALPPPPRPLRWSAAAALGAAALFAGARLSLRLIPATGEAPIQSFVSWPSGMLCFAALGTLLPLGEELFFRGYVYRVALRLGPRAAFSIAWLAFVALHAPQSWGNWGGLFAVGLAGVVLTLLRARSGSTLTPAIAHVLYNFALSMASF